MTRPRFFLTHDNSCNICSPPICPASSTISETTAMTLPAPPVSIPAKRDLNRPPVDSDRRPDFMLTSAPDRPEKQFTIRKKTPTGHPRRPLAPVHHVGRTVKTSGPQKLSAKGLSLRKTPLN